jgi:hypothetical protein
MIRITHFNQQDLFSQSGGRDPQRGSHGGFPDPSFSKDKNDAFFQHQVQVLTAGKAVNAIKGNTANV